MELIWKGIFMAVFVATFFIRLPHAKANKKAEKKSSERPGAEKFLLLVNFLTMVIMPLFVVFSPWLDGFDMNAPAWARWASAVGLTAAAYFFYVVHRTLGVNWSPLLEIKKEHTLITDGPYKYIRHPMYTYIWILVLLQGVLLSNWLLEGAGVFFWAVSYFIRLPREESMMLAEFGESYEEFRQRTGAVVPAIWRGAAGR